MKYTVFVFVILLSSCKVITVNFNEKTCNYKVYNYFYDNSKSMDKIEKYVVLSEIHFGEKFNDLSSISIYTLYKNPGKDECENYKLYFENSDTLQFIKFEEKSIVFTSENFNRNICEGKKLVFEVINRCNSKSNNKYFFERIEGEPDYPIAH